MPAVHEHIAKAQAFERVLAIFDDSNPDHWDWIAIVAFYVSLHWLDAFLATLGWHPREHRTRNQLAAMLVIGSVYADLYVASRQARYRAGHIPQDEALRMRDHNLPTVRQRVQGAIGFAP